MASRGNSESVISNPYHHNDHKYELDAYNTPYTLVVGILQLQIDGLESRTPGTKAKLFSMRNSYVRRLTMKTLLLQEDLCLHVNIWLKGGRLETSLQERPLSQRSRITN